MYSLLTFYLFFFFFLKKIYFKFVYTVSNHSNISISHYNMFSKFLKIVRKKHKYLRYEDNGIERKSEENFHEKSNTMKEREGRERIYEVVCTNRLFVRGEKKKKKQSHVRVGATYTASSGCIRVVARWWSFFFPSRSSHYLS